LLPAATRWFGLVLVDDKADLVEQGLGPVS